MLSKPSQGPTMPEFSNAQAVDAYWQGEYEFFRKIITDEVDRLRFNDGYEPVDVDLYPAGQKFTGATKIRRTQFRAIAFWCVDSHGKKILRVQIRPEPK